MGPQSQCGPSAAPQLFIVDDDEPDRVATIALLEARGFTCHGFSSAMAFLKGYGPAQPGCLVTDMAMPEMTGLELYRELQRRGWIIPTVLIAGAADLRETVKAMQQGVIAVLVKPMTSAALLDAVRRGIETDRRIRADAERLTRLNELFSLLSAGEVDVLDRLASGKSNKAIASELGIAIRSVEHRRRRVSEKLGVERLGSLVAMVMQRRHLITGDPNVPALCRGQAEWQAGTR